MPRVPACSSCPRRRHRHPGHPGHHRRRCRCHGRRQGGVGAATGHHRRNRWRPSADEWYHFNGELSCIRWPFLPFCYSPPPSLHVQLSADRWQLALASIIQAFLQHTLSPSDCSPVALADSVLIVNVMSAIVWSLVRSRLAVPVDQAGSASLLTCSHVLAGVCSCDPSQTTLTGSLSL